MRRFSLLILSFLVGSTGCGDRNPTTLPSPSPPPTSAVTPSSQARITLQLGSRSFELEVADDDPERQKGLMYRSELPAGTGMIFVFPDEEERGFWMKNTYIPLEIVYVDSKGAIVSIKRMEPHDQRSTRSGGPAQYAIELNIGDAASAGLSVGQVLSIPPDLVKAAR